MGFFDLFRRNNTRRGTPPKILSDNENKKDVIVGAAKNDDETAIQSFTNSNITFSGELAGYDYDTILRNKQDNINSLYELADYYVDADTIIRGIVKHVYTPYSSCSDWFLTEAKEKTINLYEDQYKRMRLREKIDGIMYEFWKYNNVFIYLHQGQLITLPVHKCKIGSIALNGKPLVDFDCQSILNEWRAKNYSVHENWIVENNLEKYFEGYPEEVYDAVNRGVQYAQLNPDNTFVMQGSKESWQRYAIPFIAACLIPLEKKELISKYETAILNLGIRSFVHVPYGDKNRGFDMLPDAQQLGAVRRLFQQGMSGFPLVVTNQLAEAKVVQPDMQDIFQFPKYKDVNNDILSAGGISGILVNGISEDGSTFASAQVSMQVAEFRIMAARNEFCELMNQINRRLTEEIKGTYNLKDVPKFNFKPLDMTGQKALRETCQKLWERGVVSTKTMLENHGYDLEKEREQREQEIKDGVEEVMQARALAGTAIVSKDNEGGRPELTNEERHSDPDAAERGKQPKPSNPEPGNET